MRLGSLASYTVAHFADELIRNWINKLTLVPSNFLNLRGSHWTVNLECGMIITGIWTSGVGNDENMAWPPGTNERSNIYLSL